MARYVLGTACFVLFITLAEPTLHTEACAPPECVHLDLPTHHMQVDVSGRPGGGAKLCVLCFPGLDKKWFKLWVNPKMKIDSLTQDSHIDVFYGANLSEVVERSQSAGYLRWPSLWGQLRQEYEFEPFNTSCIGVSSNRKYIVNFQVKNPDLWLVFYTALGLLLFFFAPSWSRNKFLHYGTGISVGVLGSVIIALFVINKFLPQKIKTLGSVILVVSTSASMFLLQHVTYYLNEIFFNYWQAVLGYVVVASVLSFAVVYRYGPVSNPRTLDLVRWTLQTFGLVLIYQGSQIPEMAILIVAAALLLYFFPRGLFAWLKKMRMVYFPPRLRLLTEEEYYREGQIETEKALKELREFCRSPECNAWRTISRLNTSNRFGQFMEGEDHVTEAESYEHDSTCEINPRHLEDGDSTESELSFRLNTR